MFEITRSLIRRSINEPTYLIVMLIGLIRGTCYLIYYNYLKRNIKIGFPFIVHAEVRIIGPGTVSIGKRCVVLKNAFKGLTIITFSKNAKVIVGDKCALGGTTIRCFGMVEIGNKTMTAISLIQDSFIVNYDRLGDDIKRRLPAAQNISIGTNAWLAEGSFVMNGSKIGDDCVLSSGSWCNGTAYPEYVLILGNPARSTIPIDKLLRLKGEL
jgi:acetyltransferase-like isoleucine patch superfamily enzyme